MHNGATEPATSHNTLLSVQGIDSIHIDIMMNSRDLQKFCAQRKLKLEELEQKKWEREWFIFLDGEAIRARYHKKSKRTTFELGGFLKYDGVSKRLLLMRDLMQYFQDRSWTVSRIDLAVDVNIRWDEFLPTVADIKPVFIESSIYYNELTTGEKKKPLSTLIVYDKGTQLKIFSTSLTRIEIRIFRHTLKKLGCDRLFESKEMLIRLADLIYIKLEQQLKLYSVDGSCTHTIRTGAAKTLEEFVAFVHSDNDEIRISDPFHIRQALVKTRKTLQWLQEEGIDPADVKGHIKGKKLAICKEIGVDVKTFDKAMRFYKTVPLSQL